MKKLSYEVKFRYTTDGMIPVGIKFNKAPNPEIINMLKSDNWTYDPTKSIWHPLANSNCLFIPLLLPEAVAKVNEPKKDLSWFACPHCDKTILVRSLNQDL